MSSPFLRAAAFATAFTLSALTSYLANAADLGGPRVPQAYEEPPPAPIDYGWSGWYFGGILGYGSADTDFSAPAGSFNLDSDGIVGGGLIGWNYHSGRFVLGLEGDLIAGDTGGTLPFGPNSLTANLDWMTALRTRAGVLVTPQVLFYATVGAAWGDFDLNVAGPGGASRSQDFTGLQLGGGAEVALSNNWKARFEYLHTDFDSETVTYPLGGVNVDPDVHQLRGALIFRF